jgi:hypothetical protein
MKRRYDYPDGDSTAAAGQIDAAARFVARSLAMAAIAIVAGDGDSSPALEGMSGKIFKPPA